MPTDKIIFTVSYALVILGSIGMVVFAFRFPFSTRIKDLEVSDTFYGLNGYQVWVYSWCAIIVGTAGQIVATWWC
jgi:hypothetical protein